VPPLPPPPALLEPALLEPALFEVPALLEPALLEVPALPPSPGISSLASCAAQPASITPKSDKVVPMRNSLRRRALASRYGCCLAPLPWIASHMVCRVRHCR
jgi:hypothetical protein